MKKSHKENDLQSIYFAKTQILDTIDNNFRDEETRGDKPKKSTRGLEFTRRIEGRKKKGETLASTKGLESTSTRGKKGEGHMEPQL